MDSSRIIFANPAKPASHIRHAAAMRVDTMTVDNENELHKIKKLFPTAKVIVYNNYINIFMYFLISKYNHGNNFIFSK